MASRRLKRSHPTGGSVRNPRSLANLKQGPAAVPGNRHHLRHGGYAGVPQFVDI
jgi:hypothetical protein